MYNGLSLDEIADCLKIKTTASAYVCGASVDSRLVKNRDLFFACPGQRCDGHAYLSEAAKRGASAAVVSKSYCGESYGLPLLHVEQPEVSLQSLAKHCLKKNPGKVVAITGSMGKTTTKEFLAHLLSSSYQVTKTPGNYNSQLGLPLTVLNELKGNEDFIVLEMGMTKPGQIRSLVEIAEPEVAVLTGVALAHAENFNSLADIAMAKGEIFSHSCTRAGFISRAIDNFEDIISKSQCKLNSFGYGYGHQNSLADYNLTPTQEGLILKFQGLPLITFNTFNLPGEHNIHNFLAAATAANACGLCWEAIAHSASTLKLPDMRLQVREINGITFINDAYNALPIAVKAALDSMPQPKRLGRKIVVMSEMLELGAFSENCHKEIAEYALTRADIMLCLGNGCKPIQEVWTKAKRLSYLTNDIKELKAYLDDVIMPGDVVLIKGSRSSGLAEMPI